MIRGIHKERVVESANVGSEMSLLAAEMLMYIETYYTVPSALYGLQQTVPPAAHPAAIWAVLTNEPMSRAIHLAASTKQLNPPSPQASKDTMMDSPAEWKGPNAKLAISH